VGRRAVPGTAHVRSAALTIAVGRQATPSGGHHAASASPPPADYEPSFRWKLWL